MNVKRYRAATSREALKLVKAELGEDAIILANRTVAGGVEIIAMPAEAVGSLGKTTEPIAAAGRGQPMASPPTASAPKVAKAARYAEVAQWSEEGEDQPRVSVLTAKGEREQPASQIRPFAPPRIETPDFTARREEMQSEEERIRRSLEVARQRQLVSGRSAVASKSVSAPAEKSPSHLAEQIETLHEQNALLARELQAMRSLIEQQLAGFAWNEAIRRAPARARILGEMLEAGFSPALARAVCDRLEANADVDGAREAAKARLAARLLLASAEDEILHRGGVYAIVGPTGVGKTTTTAKLAARCVVQHGALKVAMITTDGFRIGAQEQLRIYGRILGVPVFAVRDANDLRLTLQELAGKHIVLIDTVGLSQRDKRVTEQIALLHGAGPVQRLLCLNATCRGDALEDVVRAFGGEGLAGCVLTKVDEALTLAPALDVVVRHRLFVHYIANGQRVPEDLHLPHRGYLVHRAFKSAKSEEDIWRLGEDEAALWLAQGAVA